MEELSLAALKAGDAIGQLGSSAKSYRTAKSSNSYRPDKLRRRRRANKLAGKARKVNRR